LDVRDLPDCQPYEKTAKSPEVQFINCDFSYTCSKPVLRWTTVHHSYNTLTDSDVSFTIASGTTTALVGTSGSGKSTLAKLLVRLYDVKKGQILLGGKNLRSYSQASLRAAMGVVPQDTVLFNDTIKYNIMYGNMNASDAEVEAAAVLADIHDTILSFPEQVTTGRPDPKYYTSRPVRDGGGGAWGEAVWRGAPAGRHRQDPHQAPARRQSDP
jgi:ATP-binding cassette subfamily B protein